MKRYIFLAMFVAVALGMQAQYYMNLWYNDSLLKLPVLTIDSVTFTDYIPDAPTEPELPTEPTQIDALFSVGEGIVVSFSLGNLQYHPVNNTWRFAENQWDYVGEANANISATYDGWIDLFGWGTGDNPLKTSMNGDDYQTFVDWGANQIGNDAPNTWRTLTKDEWMCLLYYRTNAESLFALGQVNGVNGLIILPDRWSTPEEVTFVPSTQQGLVWDKRDYSNAAADNFAHNVYTLEQWAIMQNAGAVFIPAAGNRKGTNTFYVNEIGYCWSSTKDGVIYAYNLLFGSTTLDLQRANYLYYAFPVRLAKNMVYVPDDQGISTTGTENGYEWVDLGLLSGVKWATCNVGANSPEEYGDYFAWGEVEPKDEYSWSTYKWCDGRADALTKYNGQSSYGATDYKNFLDVEDDAAAVNLGGTWRTPTKMEFEELHGQCSWNWTTINGVDGYQVVGPNGNSIFLPAAGMYCDNDLGSFNIGTWGYYWTSLLDFSMYAYSSIFNKSYYYCYRNYTRIHGFPVRAVCNATNEEVPEEPVEPEEPDTPTEPEEPTNPSAGIGVFSVSADKQVTFSQGNLQYTQSTNTWSFAENQWDMIGTDNVTGGSVDSDQYGDSKFGDALADKIDLFGWSTSTTNFGVSRSTNGEDYAGDFVDWGINQIGDDAPNTWRTLSYDEWYYLRYTRTNADNLVGVAQVNGVNGLIFLPDNWTCPSGVTFKFGFHSERGVDYYAAYQTFTADQWSNLEAAGAVFLPASGDRHGSTVYGVHLGYYWSATENDGGNAHCFCFGPDAADMSNYYRNSGRSVRLVKDVEDEPVEPEVPEGFITCAEAVAICEATGTTSTTESYTIRGYVTEIKYAWSEQYGTATFWIADTQDGGKVLQAYSCMPLTEADKVFAVGDYVELVGKMKQYNTTSEVERGTYTHVGSTEGGETPELPYGPEATLTCAQALEVCLATGTTLTADSYTIRGYVTEIKYAWSEQYGNATFWIADTQDGGKVLQAYSCKPLTEADKVFAVGDYVELVGKMKQYNTTSEVERGTYTHVGSTEGGETPDTPEEPETPSEGIGVFSVSADKKVAFSKGNLQYHPANNEWRFAESQLDYIGDANSNCSSTYDGWLDMFGWSTSANNFGVSTSTSFSDYSGSFVDWGSNQIGSDAPKTWRTLTYDEWKYLCRERPNYSNLCGVAQVNGVNGLIFLPDNWTCPSGVTFKSGFHSEDSVEAYGQYQTFSAEQWSKLEAAGAVFLPASGRRYGWGVNRVQYRGDYWSATECGGYDAYCFSFSSVATYIFYYFRECGQSVRLVKDL